MYFDRPKGEKAAARKLVRHILLQGHRISVNDGEEWVVRKCADLAEIWQAMGNTDADWLRIYVSDGSEAYGGISLIWGNADDGSELVADYTTHPEIEALVKACEV